MLVTVSVYCCNYSVNESQVSWGWFVSVWLHVRDVLMRPSVSQCLYNRLSHSLQFTDVFDLVKHQ